MGPLPRTTFRVGNVAPCALLNAKPHSVVAPAVTVNDMDPVRERMLKAETRSQCARTTDAVCGVKAIDKKGETNYSPIASPSRLNQLEIPPSEEEERNEIP